MLKKIIIKNYKNFYDELEVDFTTDKKEGSFINNINGDNILKLGIFYGYHGSGKTNFLNVITNLFWFNIDSSQYYFKQLSVPNMIYGENENTSFKMYFCYDNKNYEYFVELNSEKVIEEYLIQNNDLLVYKRKDNKLIDGFLFNFAKEDCKDIILNNKESFLSFLLSENLYKTIFYISLTFNIVEAFNFFINRYVLIKKRDLIHYIDPFSGTYIETKNVLPLFKELVSLANFGMTDINLVDCLNINFISGKYSFEVIYKDKKYDLNKIESNAVIHFVYDIIKIMSSLVSGNLLVLDYSCNFYSEELIKYILHFYKKGMFEDLEDSSTSQLLLAYHDLTLLKYMKSINKDNLFLVYKKDFNSKIIKPNKSIIDFYSKPDLFNIPSKFFLDENWRDSD